MKSKAILSLAAAFAVCLSLCACNSGTTASVSEGGAQSANTVCGLPELSEAAVPFDENASLVSGDSGYEVCVAHAASGDYTFCISGRAINANTDYFNVKADLYVITGESKSEKEVLPSTGGQNGERFDKTKLDSCLKAYTLTQNGKEYPLVAASVFDKDGAKLSRFYTVKDGELFMFHGSSEGVSFEMLENLSDSLDVSGNTVTDKENGFTYTFDFENGTAQAKAAE